MHPQTQAAQNSDLTSIQHAEVKSHEKALTRAIGEELRRARVANGWSRAALVAKLPSGIGDRTLLSYEHGTRQLTVIRLLELSHVLRAPAPALLAQALQRAGLELANLPIRIDLQELIQNNSVRFRPMVHWAKNKLTKHPDGVAELSPTSLEELADSMGFTVREVAHFLARFLPESAREEIREVVQEDE